MKTIEHRIFRHNGSMGAVYDIRKVIFDGGRPLTASVEPVWDYMYHPAVIDPETDEECANRLRKQMADLAEEIKNPIMTQDDLPEIVKFKHKESGDNYIAAHRKDIDAFIEAQNKAEAEKVKPRWYHRLIYLWLKIFV